MVGETQGKPRPAEPHEIRWARHLMRDERDVAMQAGESLAVLYSLFEERPGPEFRLLWRSFPDALHSTYIDSCADNKEFDGMAPVKLLLYDSSSPNVSVLMRAMARRLPKREYSTANRLMLAVRRKREEEVPDPFTDEELFYEARIGELVVPVPVLRGGERVGSGYAELSPESLSGFGNDPPLAI